MVRGSEHTKITSNDLDFVAEELASQPTALSLQELIKKVAYKKNANQLDQEVKIYDPACEYKVGDLICKEYDEPLMVSSKGKEPFKGRVVLEVMNKIPFDSYNCEMLEVDYTGGGTFRKHIDYMKKTKTQVMLPSATDGKGCKPKSLKREEDPRLHELSMTEKDLRRLGKNLESRLTKSDKFFSWNNRWQLTEKQVKVSKKIIENIESGFKKTKKSASTEELAASHFDVQPGDERMDVTCLSLNYALSNSRKRNFLFVSPEGWGRWFHRDILQSFRKNNPLAVPKVKVPEQKNRVSKTPGKQFPLKVYLSWREILGGGVTVPQELKKELTGAREYRFFDVENKKEHTVYYYPHDYIFLGLDKYYQEHNIPQGASITLDKEDVNRFRFWLKKAKKKMTLPMLKYDPKKDRFAESGKEISTYAHPNKIIFLAQGTLKNILSLYDQRKDKDLRELLVLIFRHFGLEGEALTLHYQRAFHLVNMLAHTSLEDVRVTLQSSPEFAASEKRKGLFLYHEKIKTESEVEDVEEEISAEEEILGGEPAEEYPEEGLPEIGTVGEVSTPEVVLEEKKEIELPEEKEQPSPLEESPDEVAVPEPEAELEDEAELEAAVEEKPAEEGIEEEKESIRKKMELERKPKHRGGKRHIEERIEQEESEWEAFYAMKSEEEFEELEETPVSKKEEKEKKPKAYAKPAEEEKPLSGLFGEKLKSALGQKEEEPEPEKKKDADKKNKKKDASKKTKKTKK